MNNICVVIPMYGKHEMTRNCLRLALENAGVPITPVVVDDGSPEPFNSDECCVVRLEKNSGFTAAANAGILWALDNKYEYVFLLNNDTEPQKDFIKLQYDVMSKHHDIAIAGSSRIHTQPVAADGSTVENVGADLIRGIQHVSKEILEGEFIECNWLPLCSSLIRSSVIKEIGILDKRFRNHCSDSDYCIRVKIAQYKVVLVPKSKIIHYHSVTTTSSGIQADLDQKYFIEKLAGVDYAVLMDKIPLDAESCIYGRLQFSTYKK